MHIFPVTKFEIRSSAKPAEIAALLSTQVQPYPSKPRLIGERNSFTGTVSEKSFRVICVGTRRTAHAIRPSVTGDFRLSSESTIIDVTIKYDSYLFLLPIIILFIVSGWYSFQNFLLPLLEALSSRNTMEVLMNLLIPNMFMMLIPFSILLYGYLIFLLNYGIQAYKAKKTLEEILAPLISK